MPTTNLGQVRDKITAIQKTGTSGLVDTYTVKTECSPNGAGTFEVRNGENGINGADGLSLKSIGANGNNIVTVINDNNILPSNIVAILGRTDSSATSWQSLTPVFYFSNASEGPTTAQIDAVALYAADGSSIASQLSQYYQIIIMYYGSGDDIEQGYNLGRFGDIESALNAALNVYKENFTTQVEKFTSAYALLQNSNYIFILPNYSEKIGANYWATFNCFTISGAFIAKTYDSGANWSYEYNQTGHYIGAQSSVSDAITTAANYFASVAMNLDKNPYVYGTVDGKIIFLYPSVSQETVTKMKVIYDGKDYVAIYELSAWKFYEAQYFHDFGTFANETPMFIEVANASVYRGMGIGQKIKSIAKIVSSPNPTKCYHFEYVGYNFGGNWDIRFESQYESGILHVSLNPVTSVISWSTEYFSNKTKSLGTFGSRAAALSAAYTFFSNATNWFNFSVVYAMTSDGKEITIFRPSYYNAASTLWIIDPAKQYGFATTSDNGSTWTVKFYQDELDTKLTKGDYDATTGVGYADLANELETKMTVPEQNPFSFQTTAVGEEVASVAKLNALVGVDVVKNQGAKPLTSTDWTYAGTGSGSFNDGVATITTGAANNFFEFVKQSYVSVVGNKYLLMCNAKITPVNAVSKAKIDLSFRQYGAYKGNKEIEIDVNKKTFVAGIIEAENNPSTDIAFGLAYDSTASCGIGTTVEISNAVVIRLPQRYGSNDVVNAIIGTGSDQVERLLKFDPNILKDLSYDAGSFVSSKSKWLKTTGFNQWDEEWEVGYINSSGQDQAANDALRSKNLIPVIYGATYYMKAPHNFALYYYDANGNFMLRDTGHSTGVIPIVEGTSFIRFAMSGLSTPVTYNHDICISIHWDSTRDGEYEPYEQHLYELPNKQGHGILTVVGDKVVADGDELYPDGTGKENYNTVDLSQLAWELIGSGNWYFRASWSGGQLYVDRDTAPICRHPVYEPTDLNHIGVYDNKVSYDGSYIYIRTASTSNSPTGTMLYKLATPTDLTNQGTYDQNVIVDNWGTMQFLDEDGNEIAALQGLYVDYRSALKDFLEAMASRAQNAGNDGADEFVTQPELAEYVKQVDLSSGITDVAGLTYAVKKAYKTGNIVTLTIYVVNSTGSDISANATIFSLASGLYHSSMGLYFICCKNVETPCGILINSDGNVKTLTAIANTDVLTISVTYAVA